MRLYFLAALFAALLQLCSCSTVRTSSSDDEEMETIWIRVIGTPKMAVTMKLRPNELLPQPLRDSVIRSRYRNDSDASVRVVVRRPIPGVLDARESMTVDNDVAVRYVPDSLAFAAVVRRSDKIAVYVACRGYEVEARVYDGSAPGAWGTPWHMDIDLQPFQELTHYIGGGPTLYRGPQSIFCAQYLRSDSALVGQQLAEYSARELTAQEVDMLSGADGNEPGEKLSSILDASDTVTRLIAFRNGGSFLAETGIMEPLRWKPYIISLGVIVGIDRSGIIGYDGHFTIDVDANADIERFNRHVRGPIFSIENIEHISDDSIPVLRYAMRGSGAGDNLFLLSRMIDGLIRSDLGIRRVWYSEARY
jgi:hypothetical protein